MKCKLCDLWHKVSENCEPFVPCGEQPLDFTLYKCQLVCSHIHADNYFTVWHSKGFCWPSDRCTAPVSHLQGKVHHSRAVTFEGQWTTRPENERVEKSATFLLFNIISSIFCILFHFLYPVSKIEAWSGQRRTNLSEYKHEPLKSSLQISLFVLCSWTRVHQSALLLLARILCV